MLCTMTTSYESCRKEISETSCNFAVFCSYTSASLWFIVLLPQVYKNWRSKSVEALSILWATALFTASIINNFYIFHVSIAVFFRISFVFVSIVSMLLLIQFWVYSKEIASMKFYYGGGCFILWTALITLELALNVKEAAAKIQWIAIVLWTLETFPQIIINIRLRTTSGQCTPTVVLTLVAKTFEFLAHRLLDLPEEYKYMTYFSSTLAYVNGMQALPKTMCLNEQDVEAQRKLKKKQVIWYPKPQPRKTTIPHLTYGSHRNRDEEPLEANDCDEDLLTADTQHSVEVDDYSEEEMASICAAVRPQYIEWRPRFRDIPKYQLLFLVYLVLMLVAFAISLCVNLESSVPLLAPIGVGGIFLAIFVYRGHRESRLGCLDPVFSWCGSCCADQSVQSTW